MKSCLVKHNLNAIMALIPQGFLRIFGVQYITDISLVFALNPNFFEYSTFPAIIRPLFTFDLV